MAFKQPLSVLVLIHTHDNQVLLLDRAKPPAGWQSVTGSCDEAEDLRTTACREVAEETGLQIDPALLCDWALVNRYEIAASARQRYAPDISHNIEHVFSLCLPEPCPVRLAAGEHLAYQWLPQAQAAALCFSWSNRDAILMLPRGRTAKAPSHSD